MKFFDPIYHKRKKIIAKEMHDGYPPLVQILNAREIKVLLYRYGFQGDPLTLEQIGKKLKISRERVRQIEEAALNKIK